MKKKLTCFKSFLIVAVFAAALGACRSDELATKERSTAEKEQTQRADTFSLKLDFSSTSIAFNSKITAVSDVTVADEANAKDKNTRAALHVNQDGTTTINLTTEGGPLKVLLILRNQDGSKVYVSPDNNWTVVSGTKVEASGIYTFTAVKGTGGAPTMTKDDVWYLDAMTGGVWDAATKAYNINKTCAIPKKMFNPGEKVKLGTNMADANTDIVVPFQLGTNDVANAGVRKWGVRMAVANNDRNSSDLSPRLVCIDPQPNFSPYGSLLCMRFRNAVTAADDHGAHSDPVFAGKTAIPSNYSFYLRQVSVESTSSTTGGRIKVAELGSPYRQILPWHGYRPGGGNYTYATNHQEPFKSSTTFDKVVAGKNSSGYFLAKGTGGTPGAWTPYYYLWVKSLDESRDVAIDGSDGLKVRCTMYNHTVKPETLGGTNALYFSRVFVKSNKMHKSGRAYFSDRSLDGEIFMPATFYMAPDILYHHPGHNRTLTWPDSAAGNNEVAENARFLSREVLKNFSPGTEFSVDVFKGPQDQRGTSTTVKWIVPSPMMINSVFPPELPTINSTNKAKAGAMEKVTQQVNINGRVFTGVSYFYNPWDYDAYESTSIGNYHVYYGLRFVGTPYCEVVRYTFFDEWAAPASGTVIPDATRFIMHSKHLGDVSFANEAEIKKFFEQEVRGVDDAGKALPKPKPGGIHNRLGTPPYNKFWGDFWHPKIEDGVTMRIIHSGGARGLGGHHELGRALALGVFTGGKVRNMPEIQAFEFSDGGRTGKPYNFLTVNANPAWTGAKVSILPFISPIPYTDSPTTGERQ